MADIYLSNDALLQDYEKLDQEYKNKVGKYIKNLLKIQRAESGVSAQLFKLERTQMLAIRKDPKKYYCSFCGKTDDDANRLIVGPNRVCICDECARLCGEILDDTEAEDSGHEEETDHAEMGKERQ